MPSVDLHRKLRDILTHTVPLPTGADSPIQHFSVTGTEIECTLDYFERKTTLSPSRPSTAGRHLGRLRQMALVSLIENLERFFKELAAECVDILAPITADDRFDTFRMNGGSVAGHFGTETLGKALCETGTWLDCKTVNERFREILADATSAAPILSPFHLLPLQPPSEREWYDSLQLIWQLRHTVVHNVGVITQSDAVRLRVLSKRLVEALRILVPDRDDIRYLGRLLDEIADRCNSRVGMRLAEVLSRIHAQDPTLFDPSERAGYLAAKFRIPITIGVVTHHPPP